jgi:hypothetical protein
VNERQTSDHRHGGTVSGRTPRSRRAIRLTLLLVGLVQPLQLDAQRSWPVELQVTQVYHNVKQYVVDGKRQTPEPRAGSLQGVEGVLLGKNSGVGLFGRYLSGTVGPVSGQHVREGGILLGSHDFRIEVGYAERLGALTDTTYRIVRGGFTGTSDLGTSGLAIRLRANVLVPFERLNGEAKRTLGWEGETGIAYTWNRVPLTASVGYRLERLFDLPRDQELSGLVIGFGLWLKP